MPMKDIVHYQLETGSPITVEETTLTPQSQVLTVRWPNGGWVWNRPVAVLVEQDGEIERLPIVDVTRYAQLGFVAFGIFFALLTLLVKLGGKRGN
jgi:hypothetical protein